MGSCISTKEFDTSDIMHPLSQNQRKERLIDAYAHSIAKLQKMIPNDIKSILNMYLQSMDEIKSQTEIENEERRRREHVCNYLYHLN